MEPTFISTAGAVAVSMLFVADPGLGMAQDPDQALHDWQVRRLCSRCRTN